jgi:hypothetical protein
MAKLDGQVPNPGAGGTYLLDPETGELKLTQSTTAQENNGTDPQEVSDRKDRVNLRDGPKPSGRQ